MNKPQLKDAVFYRPENLGHILPTYAKIAIIKIGDFFTDAMGIDPGFFFTSGSNELTIEFNETRIRENNHSLEKQALHLSKKYSVVPILHSSRKKTCH